MLEDWLDADLSDHKDAIRDLIVEANRTRMYVG